RAGAGTCPPAVRQRRQGRAVPAPGGPSDGHGHGPALSGGSQNVLTKLVPRRSNVTIPEQPAQEGRALPEPLPVIASAPPPPRDIWNPPVLGASAVLLGAASLSHAPLLLGPAAVFFGFLAVLFRQRALGAIGAIAGAAAMLTSPWLWGLIGV